MKRAFACMLAALLAPFCILLHADTVATKDGKEFVGKVVEQTDEHVRLRTGYGDLVIPRADVESLKFSTSTVHLKDGKTLEGMVAEEDSQKVVLRTRYGELTIPRADIARIDRPGEYLPGERGKAPEPEPVKKLSEEEVRQLHRRGIKVLQQKDYDGAIEIFKKLAAHNAEDATARYNLACACSLKGEKAAALDALEADFKKWIADAPEPAGATPRGAPFLGVGTSGTAAGMHVLQVVQGSPAEEAGVKAGDIIVEFAGARYTNRDEFANAIRAQDTREPVTIKVLRGDELLELRVVLAPEE